MKAGINAHTGKHVRWNLKADGWEATFKGLDGKPVTVNTLELNKRNAEKMVREAKLHIKRSKNFQKRVDLALHGGKKTTFKKATDEWLDQAERFHKIKPSTLQNYLLYLRKWWREHALEDEHPCTFTAEMAYKIVNPKDNTSAGTRKFSYSLLNQFCKWLLAAGYTRCNPCEQIGGVDYTLLSHAQKEPRKKVPFTDEEIARLKLYIITEMGMINDSLIANQPSMDSPETYHHAIAIRQQLAELEFWMIAVTVARYAGLRLGDIATLEWASLAKPGVLICHTAKRDVRVEVPVGNELSAMFTVLGIPYPDERYCFPSQARTHLSPLLRARLPTAFRQLLKRAGISNRSFHCTRSAFEIDAVQRFIAAGKTEDEAVALAAALCGHTPEVARRYYLHSLNTTTKQNEQTTTKMPES